MSEAMVTCIFWIDWYYGIHIYIFKVQIADLNSKTWPQIESVFRDQNFIFCKFLTYSQTGRKPIDFKKLNHSKVMLFYISEKSSRQKIIINEYIKINL